MSKPKYSSEFKIMIAETYLNGEGGFMKKPGNASYSLQMAALVHSRTYQ